MQYKELIDDDGIKLVKKLCLRKYGDPMWSEYITINKVLTEFIGLGYNVYGNCEHSENTAILLGVNISLLIKF